MTDSNTPAATASDTPSNAAQGNEQAKKPETATNQNDKSTEQNADKANKTA